jgi:hypothetical protein
MLANTIISALVLGSAAISCANAAAVTKRDVISEWQDLFFPFWVSSPHHLSPTFFTRLEDGQIANIALTLEFLESTFYTQYLNQFDATAFKDAG